MYQRNAMRISNEEYQTNYEVLSRLWNDPKGKIRSKIMGDLFSDSVAENEVLIREDDLRAAGYIGRLPSFLLKFRRFGFICWPAYYGEYWLRQKSIDKKGLNLYSIFKD